MRVTLIYPSVGRKENTPYVRAWQMQPLSMALLASLMPPDAGNRPQPREQPRSVCVDSETLAVEPLDLPVATGDQREAFDVELYAEAVRLRDHAHVFQSALLLRDLLGIRRSLKWQASCRGGSTAEGTHDT